MESVHLSDIKLKMRLFLTLDVMGLTQTCLLERPFYPRENPDGVGSESSCIAQQFISPLPYEGVKR